MGLSQKDEVGQPPPEEAFPYGEGGRAIGSVAAQTLCDLIADVACVDVREDEGVCVACDLGARCFELTDFRCNRSVKL